MAPDLARVIAAHDDLARQYHPPPHTASRQRQWAPMSLRRWSRAPRAPLAGAVL